jgi:pilus assembly protein CpaB
MWRRNGSTEVELAPIVVALRSVPRGGVIRADSVRTVDWPKQTIPTGALTRVEDAVDRCVIVPLVGGEPVFDSKLASKDSGSGLASMVPPGMRAFTIEAAHLATGVGGFVLPGDSVDVLLTTRSHSRDDETGGGATTTLLQNVSVLAVAQRLDAPEENRLDPKELKSITLLVTPDQAAKLDLGMSLGTLHLTLRNPEDDAEAKTLPATMAQLRFHQEKPPKPVAALGHLVNGLINGADREEKSQAEETEECQFAEIRTLRGSQRGFIRVQLYP